MLMEPVRASMEPKGAKNFILDEELQSIDLTHGDPEPLSYKGRKENEAFDSMLVEILHGGSGK